MYEFLMKYLTSEVWFFKKDLEDIQKVVYK